MPLYHFHVQDGVHDIAPTAEERARIRGVEATAGWRSRLFGVSTISGSGSSVSSMA